MRIIRHYCQLKKKQDALGAYTCASSWIKVKALLACRVQNRLLTFCSQRQIKTYCLAALAAVQYIKFYIKQPNIAIVQYIKYYIKWLKTSTQITKQNKKKHGANLNLCRASLLAQVKKNQLFSVHGLFTNILTRWRYNEREI